MAQEITYLEQRLACLLLGSSENPRIQNITFVRDIPTVGEKWKERKEEKLLNSHFMVEGISKRIIIIKIMLPLVGTPTNRKL